MSSPDKTFVFGAAEDEVHVLDCRARRALAEVVEARDENDALSVAVARDFERVAPGKPGRREKVPFRRRRIVGKADETRPVVVAASMPL